MVGVDSLGGLFHGERCHGKEELVFSPALPVTDFESLISSYFR